ncbi:MAG: hypothetical protein IPK82_05625 [Polyangiaceae bacterium]|nr:hypothetical protein [Polyangiaceae bacterium]
MRTTAKHRLVWICEAVCFGAVLGAASVARADEPSNAAGAPSAAKTESVSPSKDAADPKKNVYTSGPKEDPLKRYYFLGARFRDVVVPQFMLEIFAKGGETGNVWLVGPELSTRKNGVEMDISLVYADYGFGPAMFKAKDDPDIGYEIVRSDLKLGYLTFDLLFDFPIDQGGIVSFLIGGGIGVGVVAGDLYRVQAYPKSGTPNPNDVSAWEKCTGAGGEGGVFCDTANNHYYDPASKKDYSEKSWLEGGSKPVVIPWISLPQLSLRVKPIKQLQMRADVGFSLSGFFFGISAGYGF